VGRLESWDRGRSGAAMADVERCVGKKNAAGGQRAAGTLYCAGGATSWILWRGGQRQKQKQKMEAQRCRKTACSLPRIEAIALLRENPLARAGLTSLR